MQLTRAARAVLEICAVLACQQALANPTGPQVVSGNAVFAQKAGVLNVTNSNGAIINWNSFSIGRDETTRFIQASAASSVLNRVVTSNPSTLLGTLSSNGQVWLVNPAGIMVGAGARIDVGAFIASTLNVRNEDFLAGRLTFGPTPGAGKIENHGLITTPSGGRVYLVAPNVENHGVINAPRGEVILAAGQTVQIGDTGTPGVKVEVTGAEGNVTNLGSVMAEAGRIGLAGVIVKNSGSVNASSVVNEGGQIFLRATRKIDLAESSRVSADGTKGGQVVIKAEDGGAVSGELIARGVVTAQGDGSRGSGGFIETSAAKTDLNGVDVITRGGQWLIDPNDFTIAASGGDLTGSALATALASNDVTIQTTSGGAACTNVTCTSGTTGNGDIFVKDDVAWAAHKLTLSAYRNVGIQATLDGSGTASLALEFGQGAVAAANTASYTLTPGAKVHLPAGNNFSTKLGSDGATNAYQVITSLGAAGSTTGTDLQGMQGGLAARYALGADIDASATSGWNSNAGFQPVGSSTTKFTGRFDGLGHVVSGLAINRAGSTEVGLFGYASGADIRNVGISGASVAGSDYTGLLAGYVSATAITNASVSGTVSGGSYAGGMVGQLDLVSSLTKSYSSASVSGASRVGGLVGDADKRSVIRYSYSSGSASGVSAIGGLVGALGVNNYAGSTDLDSSYSTASVTSTGYYAGGLVGMNHYYGNIITSHSSGAVSGVNNVGGLSGLQYGWMTGNSYWDTETSGQSTSYGGTGRTTAQLMSQATFSGWDFTNTWWLSEGYTRPFLRSEFGANIGNAHQLQLVATNLAGRYKLSGSIDMSELTRASGMWKSTAGFVPLGNETTGFTGVLDGQYKTVNNLYINRAEPNATGLFGVIGSAGVVKNVGVLGGSVTGSTWGSNAAVGALAGSNSGSILNSYATADVNGARSFVGGLVGFSDGTIAGSYAAGNVTLGESRSGGLVGQNNGTISDSYSTGSVRGGCCALGGLVGHSGGGSITNSYSTSYVAPSNTWYQIGGVRGEVSGGSVSNSYWDTSTSGLGSSNGGTGLTTAQAMQSGNYSGFDFTNTWGIVAGTSYPYLKWQFSGTPQIVSGTAAGLGAGKSIQAIANGAKLANTYTGANGFYYFALPGNSVASGKSVVTYVAGDSYKGAAAFGSTGSHATGMAIAQDTLGVGGSGASNAGLGVAKGSLTSTDIPYSVSGSNLTVTTGTAFQTLSGASYTLDGNVTTSDKAQTWGSAVTMSSNATLASGSGNIAINGAFSGAGRNLTLNSTGTVTQSAAISVAGLELLGAGGTYTLTNAGNAITTLAANTGSVNFAESNGFTVGTVGSTNGVTASGNVTLTANGTLTVSKPVASTGGGNILLAAQGSTSAAELYVNANVTASGGTGSIDLYSGAGMQISGSGVNVAAAGAGPVNIYVGRNYNNGTVQAGIGANLYQGNGASVKSDDGNINLYVSGNMQVDEIHANANGDSAWGDVLLKAGDNTYGVGYASGTIDSWLGTSARPFVTANKVSLRATGNIGWMGNGPNHFYVDATELDVNITGGHAALGDMNDTRGDGLKLTNIVISGNTGYSPYSYYQDQGLFLQQTNTGGLKVGSIDVKGPVHLVTSGSITDALGTGTNIISRDATTVSSGIVLRASGSVGTLGAPIRTQTTRLAGTLFDKGVFAVSNTGNLEIGSVLIYGTHNGITMTNGSATAGSDIKVDTTGALSITQPVANRLAGNVTLTGASYSQADADVSTGSGAIRISADAVAIAANTGNNAFQTTGALTLTPKTATTAMSLGGSAAFDLTAAEVTAIAGGVTGAGTITIGDAANSNAAATLTTGAPVNFGAKPVTLNAASFASAGTDTITAASLTLNATSGSIGSAPGASAIDVAVTNLAINAPGGNAYVKSAGGYALTAAGVSGTLSLDAGGTVTQSAPVTAAGLELLGAGATFTLTNPGNSIDTLAGNTGSVNLVENSGFAVGTVNTVGLTTTGTTTLNSTSSVTQSAPMTAPGLQLLGGGAYTLNDPGNRIAVLAGSTAGLNVANSELLTIGTVGTTGLSVGGNLTLGAASLAQTAALSVTGSTTLGATAGSGDIVLSNGGNSLRNVTINSGRDVSVASTYDSGVTIGLPQASAGLRDVTIAYPNSPGIVVNGNGSYYYASNPAELSGNLSITAGGNISPQYQNGYATYSWFNLTGPAATSSFTFGGDVWLATGNNNLGAVTLTPTTSTANATLHNGSTNAGIALAAPIRNLTLTQPNGSISLPDNKVTGSLYLNNKGGTSTTDTLALGTQTLSGSLQLYTEGSITQTGPLTVAGATTLETSAGSADIVLNDPANALGSVTVNSGRDLSLASAYAGGVTVSLPQSAGGLRDVNIAYPNSASVVISGNGSYYYASNPAELSGNLSITAGGNISAQYQNGYGTYSWFNLTGTGASSTFTAGGDITMHSGNNNLGAVTLTPTAGTVNANIYNGSPAASLTLTSPVNNLTLSQPNHDITLAANKVTGSLYLNTQGGTSTGISVGAQSLSGSLELYADSGITQTGALSVGGGTTVGAAAGSGDILLDNAANSLRNVTVNAGRDVTLASAYDGGVTLGLPQSSAGLRDVSIAYPNSPSVVVNGNGSYYYASNPAELSGNLSITAGGSISPQYQNGYGTYSWFNLTGPSAQSTFTLGGDLWLATGSNALGAVTITPTSSTVNATLYNNSANAALATTSPIRNLTLTQPNAGIVLAANVVTGTLSVDTRSGTSGSDIAVGAQTLSGTMALRSDGTISQNGAWSTGGAVTLDTANPVTLASSITTANGAIAFPTAVTLAGDVSIDTGRSPGGTITFQSTIDGAHSLGLLAGSGSGVVLNGAVGSGTPLASFSANANSITAQGLSAGNVSLAGNGMTLNGDLSGHGTLALGPYSAGTSIGLGGAAGTLNLDPLLARAQPGFNRYVLGSAEGTGRFTANAYTAPTGVALAISSGGSGSAGIALNGAINTGASSLSLTSGGPVTQSAPITANGLELLGTGGNFVLDRPDNAIATLAGNTGTVHVAANGGFEIGTVNTVGLTTTGTTTLSTTGGVSQSAPISAAGLALVGTGGTYTLTNPGNVAGSLAGNTGAISFKSSGDISVGTVGTAGIVTTGALSLEGATIGQTAPISVAGATSLTAGAANGDIVLDNASNSLRDVTVRSGRDVTIGSAHASAVTVELPQSSAGVRNVSIAYPNASSVILSAKGCDYWCSGGSPAQIGGNLAVTSGGTIVHGGAPFSWIELTGSTASSAFTAGGDVVLNRPENRLGAVTVNPLAAAVGVTLYNNAANAALTAVPTGTNPTARLASLTLTQPNAGIELATPISGNLNLSTSGGIRLTGILGGASASLGAGAGTGDIVLDNTSNTLRDVTVRSGRDVTIKSAYGGTVTVALPQAAGGVNNVGVAYPNATSVLLSATGCDYWCSGGSPAQIAGDLAVTSGGTIGHGGAPFSWVELTGSTASSALNARGDVVLNRPENRLGAVTFTGKSDGSSNVDLHNTSSNASLTLSNPVTNLTLRQPDNGIALADNKVTGALYINTQGGTSGSDISVGSQTLGASMSLLSDGAVSQTGILSVAGGTTLAGAATSGDIVLGNTGNSLHNVTVLSGRNVTVNSAYAGAVTVALPQSTGGVNNVSIAYPNASSVVLSATGCDYWCSGGAPAQIAGNLEVSSGGTIVHGGAPFSWIELTGSKASSTFTTGADVTLDRPENSLGSVTVTGRSDGSTSVSLYNNASNASLTLVNPVTNLTLRQPNNGVSIGANRVTGTLSVDTRNGFGGSNISVGAQTLNGSATLMSDGMVEATGALTANTVTASAVGGMSFADPANAIANFNATNVMSGDVVLNNSLGAGNTLTVTGSNTGYAAGAFRVNETTGHLAVGSGTLASSGTISLSAAGNLTIGSGAGLSASDAGDAVVLSAGGSFVNNAGASAINLDGGGRWLIYAADPSTSTFGNLDSGNTALWNATQASLPPGSIAATGKRYVFAYQPVISVTTTDVSKVYGDDASTVVAASYTIGPAHPGVPNAFLGDVAGTVLSGVPGVSSAGAPASAHVNGYDVVASAGSLAASGGYAIAYNSTGRLTVSPAPLTLTASDRSKVYGDSVVFSGTEFTPTGLKNGETVGSLSLSSEGAPPTAGASGKAYSIDAGSANGGTFTAGDYAITYVPGSLTVNPAPLTLTANNLSKVYGNTVAFTGAEFTPTGLKNAETVGSLSLSSAGAAATAQVAGGPYAIVASDATGGTFNVNNYSISYVPGVLTVAPAPLTLTAGDRSKVYGSAVAFTGTEFTSSGLKNGETVGILSLASAGTAANAHVAAGPYAISGSAATGGTFTASNYAISYVPGSLTVTPAPLTLTAASRSKVYGSAVSFAGTEFTPAGLVNGETVGSVSLASAGAAATALVVATPYTVTASAAAGGTFTPSDYSISYVAGTMTVTPAPLTVTAAANSKVYDATPNAAATPTITSGALFGTDTVVLKETYADKHAGTGKTLTPSATISDGNGGNNYSVTYVPNTGGVITAAPLMLGAMNDDRSYNGTALSSAVPTAIGLQGSDSLTGLTQRFDSRNAGSRTLSIYPGYAINDGNGGANYSVTTYTASGYISPAPLTLGAAADARTYNGTTNSAGAPNASGLFAGDTVSGLTQSFDSRNAGSRTLSVNAGYTVNDGNGGANYTVAKTTAAGTIFAAPLTVTAQGETRQYNGTAYSSGVPVVTGELYGDTIATVPTQAFDTRHAGTGKTLSASGLVVDDGNAGGNFSITYVPSTAGTITPAPLTVSAVGNAKVYDATTDSAAKPVMTAGALFDADKVILSQAYANKNAGNGKTLTPTAAIDDGNGGNNYSVTYVPNLSGVIVPAPLVVGAVGNTKVYDSTTAAAAKPVIVSGALLGTDTAALSQAYADKNAGTDKTLIPSAAISDGNGGGNYSVSYLPYGGGVITRAPIAVGGVVANGKTYDGGKAATLDVTGATTSGVFAGDAVKVLSGTASFADRNAGSGKSVSGASFALGGADAGNYTVTASPSGLTATIAQLASVAWVGGTNTNWSEAANWAGGALPDGSNVLAVTIPSGATVTYDAGTKAASTTLDTLTSSGALTLAGGTGSLLTVQRQFTASELAMNSGSLAGNGSLAVNGSFIQTGGTIAIGGSAGITQASGNLVVGSLSAANVNLAATAGAIGQSGPMVTSLLAAKAASGIALTDTGNRIRSFSADNSSVGNVALNNIGALRILGISNATGRVDVDNTGAVEIIGKVIAPTNAVSIVAHSPLTVGSEGISAGGNISLIAGETTDTGDHLTLSGPVVTSGRGASITLAAGDNLQQNASVTANGGPISASSQAGNITMGAGASTSSGGGAIDYAATAGKIVLTSLDAGTNGAISLAAGSDIQSAQGYSGANLVGATARITSGGTASMQTQVRLLDVSVSGNLSIADKLTGTVISNAPSAETLAPVAKPVVEQLVSTMISTTQQTTPTTNATSTAGPTTAPPVLPASMPSGGTTEFKLGNTTMTTGGTAGTFGGPPAAEPVASTAPAVRVGPSDRPRDTSATDKPAAQKQDDGKSADAKRDESKKEDKKDDKEDEEKKKKKGEETAAKKPDKPAAKKPAVCN